MLSNELVRMTAHSLLTNTSKSEPFTSPGTKPLQVTDIGGRVGYSKIWRGLVPLAGPMTPRFSRRSIRRADRE
jgi:hypothetical protein